MGFFPSSATFPQSSNGSIATANTGDKWFVDSVRGLDSNTGKSPDKAFKTIAKLLSLAIKPNTSISLARGSYWRESLDLMSVNNVSVTSYGSGKLPVLDASDIVPNNNFTLVSGQTKTYQTTWSSPDAEAIDYGKKRYSVWENGIRLTRRASVAAVESNPGSFYAPPPVTGTQIISVSATDGSNISSNGKKYEISRRNLGVRVGDFSYVEGVHTKNNLGNDGSLVLGNECLAENSLCEDGTTHNFLIGSGVVKNVICYKEELAEGPGSATMFVAFTNNTRNRSIHWINCHAIVDIFQTGNIGFYNHSSEAGVNHQYVVFDGCTSINLESAFNGNADIDMIFNNCFAEECVYAFGGAANNNAVISNCESRTLNALNCKLITVYALKKVIIDRFKCVTRGASGALVIYPQSTDLTITNSTLSMRNHAGTMIAIGMFGGGKLKLNNNIFDQFYHWNFELFNGVTIDPTSDNNCYFQNNGFNLNGTVYSPSNFNAYKAATGAEANSIISANPKLLGDPRDRNYNLAPDSPALALQSGTGVGANRIAYSKEYLASL